MNKISFSNADVKFTFEHKKSIIRLIDHVFSSESKIYKGIQFIFCSDDYLLSINKQFLDHNFYTDIITFPLHESGAPIESEIYISIDRIKENAATYKSEFKDELLRVIIHGVLHLCGYRDKTAAEKKAMRRMESYYLQSFTDFT